MPVNRQVLLETAWRVLLLKANWMSDILKKKRYMCHFSTASPWLSSDNNGITTRVKLKPSTVSEYKTERDTQHLQVLKSHLQEGKASSASLLSHLKEESQSRYKRKMWWVFFPQSPLPVVFYSHGCWERSLRGSLE